MSRFKLVNTELLRELRVQRGWSQKDLAKRAGYTDRLVRKAELGGKLDVETIRNTAEALRSTFSMTAFFMLVISLRLRGWRPA